MANVVDTVQKFTAQKQQEKKDAAKLAKADGTNPSSQLDKDAFMKLLLTELQYQDPTSPMDTEKMLTQTSQLATLEMQENTNSTMKELANQLKSSSNMFAVAALGKMASRGSDKIKIAQEGQNWKIPIYFKNSVKDGRVEILDDSKNIIKTIRLDESSAGVRFVEWNGLTDKNNPAKVGSYSVRATYTGQDDKNYQTEYGNYPVESVKFVDGKAKVKIAGEYIDINDISEFYEG